MVRILDPENPSPGGRRRNDTPQDGAEYVGYGERKPDHSTHQTWLVCWTNFEQRDLG